ncbi:MAG TPA: hypothetical protein VFE51_02235 [Verrucomicrobiae bacterium]|nr:hypothetical protein [Verrucomicrobiae bacterium]
MIALLALGTAIQGCSKKQDVGLDTVSFSSAPPELKQRWDAAGQSAARKDYLGAATNLIEIFGKAQQLTTEQNDALTQAWEKLGNQAFAAANQGDKSATEAVLRMKQAGIGERRSR